MSLVSQVQMPEKNRTTLQTLRGKLTAFRFKSINYK